MKHYFNLDLQEEDKNTLNCNQNKYNIKILKHTILTS